MNTQGNLRISYLKLILSVKSHRNVTKPIPISLFHTFIWILPPMTIFIDKTLGATYLLQQCKAMLQTSRLNFPRQKLDVSGEIHLESLLKAIHKPSINGVENECVTVVPSDLKYQCSVDSLNHNTAMERKQAFFFLTFLRKSGNKENHLSSWQALCHIDLEQTFSLLISIWTISILK